MLAVLVAVVALSFSAFAGRFERTKELVVVSDRAGLVMDPGAKVKMHGVTVGKVAAVNTDGRLARITLAIEPSQFGLIPADASAQIKATTAFGAKYVSLQASDFGGPKVTNGQTIKALNVTTEVNTLFQSLVGVMDSIDPAKLNATLNGISQALSERGPRKLGQLITEGNAVLSEINPLMPTITDDLRRFTAVADTYGDAADNIVTMLSNATVTSRTIVDEQRNLDALLASAIGLATLVPISSGDRHEDRRRRAATRPDHGPAVQVLTELQVRRRSGVVQPRLRHGALRRQHHRLLVGPRRRAALR